MITFHPILLKLSGIKNIKKLTRSWIGSIDLENPNLVILNDYKNI